MTFMLFLASKSSSLMTIIENGQFSQEQNYTEEREVDSHLSWSSASRKCEGVLCTHSTLLWNEVPHGQKYIYINY